MLERIREGSQGVAAKTVLGLVILTFALSGISSYINSKADSAVASVNGVEISKSEFEQAYQSGRDRMRSQFGEMADQLMADESYVANFRKNVLDRLVVQELQQQQAVELGIRVSDEQIRDAIREMPQFQQAGSFNNEVYLASLRQAGYNPSQFRDYLRQQMALSQYNGAIMGSEFVLPSEEINYSTLNNQVRGFDVLTIEAKALEDSIVIEDADLDAYYQANILSYQTPEKVAVEYLVIDSDKLAQGVNVDDSELTAYYEDNKVEYSQPEKRRIAHILIENNDGAEEKVQTVQSKIDANEDFAALAKQYSDDTFSAENGGDLEYFEAGIFGDEFDAAVMSLNNVNDVTTAVETDAGTHFIKLTEIQPELVTPFEQVKSKIKEDIVQSKVSELYIEAQTNATEVAFEVPDTLEDAAKEAGVTLQTQALSARYQLSGVLANVKVADKLFDPEFIAEGLNSDLIEVDDKVSVIVRVTDNEAPRQQSLDEVKTQVTSAVKREKSSEAALVKANEMLQKLGEGTEVSAIATEFNAKSERFDEVTRIDTQVNGSIRSKVFAMPKPLEGKLESEVVELSNGAALVVLNNVATPEVKDNEQQVSRVASIVNQLSANSLIEAAKLNADIE